MTECRRRIWYRWTPKYRERPWVRALPVFVQLRQKQVGGMEATLRHWRVSKTQAEISNILRRQNPVHHCIWDGNGSVRLPRK
jgi:hypothetical protein